MRALKLNRRPPFTTLAQRLMNTTFSVVSPLAGAVRSVVRESLRLPWLPAYAILKFQSTFPRRVGQRFHFAVVKKSTTIKNRLVDILRQQTLRDQLPDFLRCRAIGGMLARAAQFFFRRPGRDQGLTRFVIDHLRVNMFAGKIDAETRTFRRPGNLPPNTAVDASADDFSINRSHDY